MHGRHILYAEDSILSQRIVKRMLDRVGVHCTAGAYTRPILSST